MYPHNTDTAAACCCTCADVLHYVIHRHFEVLFGLLEHARITGDHTTAAAVWTLLMNLPTNTGLLQQVMHAGLQQHTNTNTSIVDGSSVWQSLLVSGSNWYKLAYTLQVHYIDLYTNMYIHKIC
jgi:hypothetical protein